MKISFDPTVSRNSQSFGINKDRQPIVAGNWKCNMTSQQALQFAEDIQPKLNKYNKPGADKNSPTLVIAPGFLQIADLFNTLSQRLMIFMLGAQNGHYKHKDAYTGEVSMEQLKEAGVETVIIGHSERRANDNETDEKVNLKVKKALASGLIPIACVGETRAEREAGRTEEVISRQVVKALSDISSEDISKVVIAYEPVWAIGKGATPCSTDEANRVVGNIRELVRETYGDKADEVRILYGGNANPDNISDLMIHNGTPTEIDGALIGGAALDPVKLASMYDQTAAAWETVKA